MGLSKSLIEARMKELLHDPKDITCTFVIMEGEAEEWEEPTSVGCMHIENDPNQNYLRLRNKRGKGKG